ncbi:MAG TPA: Flp pilus assembly protein CpaB [Marmoricola sp.]|nr:Flp pilus assembly protein CpaB [Marmoricola sp.]
MDRRRVLLVVAAIIAALGTLLVFLYVRGADDRANQKYHAVGVLKAVKQINIGETVAAAQAAGKIEKSTVGQGERLPDALDTLDSISTEIAQTNIYPGEQIIASKFGTSTASANTLTIPKGNIAVSINLTDTARVAGFVNPGDKVAIFMNSTGGAGLGSFTRLLLTDVEVIAVGTTTMVSTTTTTASGAQTTEQLPRTLFTLGVTQAQAEKILFASGSGELAFGLLNQDSKVAPDAGANADNLFK